MNSVRYRFIPAPAGNSSDNPGAAIASPVHPRACGEQHFHKSHWPASNGSSPRLRGTAQASVPAYYMTRFIPAPAGNSLAKLIGLSPVSVHPRACGEQMNRTEARYAEYGSSPRLRGTVHSLEPIITSRRFIPAPAGNRQVSLGVAVGESVHPRACGEQVHIHNSHYR